jgi:hypothetical protein
MIWKWKSFLQLFSKFNRKHVKCFMKGKSSADMRHIFHLICNLEVVDLEVSYTIFVFHSSR